MELTHFYLSNKISVVFSHGLYSPYFDLPIFKASEVGEYFFPGNPRLEWRNFPLVWSEGTLGVVTCPQ